MNGKKFLIDFLKKKKIKFLNTHTNFIYIQFDNINYTKEIISQLASNKILVKGPYNTFPFNNMIRVTVGKTQTMKKFIQGLLTAQKVKLKLLK